MLRYAPYAEPTAGGVAGVLVGPMPSYCYISGNQLRQKRFVSGVETDELLITFQSFQCPS